MPALKIVVMDPMIGFFFEHIEEDEEDFFIHYAESMGMISPERRSGHFSDASFGRTGSKRHFHRLSSDPYNTSQVGLSLFDDGIQSMVSTESSGSFTAVIPMQSPSRKNSGLASATQSPSPAPPGPATPSLQHSPSRKNRSVHFGLHDESQSHTNTASSVPALLDNRRSGDYSLSYSDISLQALDMRESNVPHVGEDENLVTVRR